MPVVVGDAYARQLQVRLAEAVAAFELETGITATVYLGNLTGADPFAGDIRAFAESALARVSVTHPMSVAIVVAPNERRVEVRTSAESRFRLSDQACALATLSMTTSFGVGDLIGGVVLGLRMLADSVVPGLTAHGRPPATSSTTTVA